MTHKLRYLSVILCTVALCKAGIQEQRDAATSRARPEGEIVGLVRDQASHQPLIGVNVLVVGTDRGAASDESGRFRIKNIQTGTYNLRASIVGYTTLVKTDVVVAAGRKTQVLIEMEDKVLKLDEFTVRA